MPRGRFRRGDRGQDVVEAALLLPLLIVLLIGIIEFAWAVFAYDTVANAAREVARCCIIASEDPLLVSRCQEADSLALCKQTAIDQFSTAVNLTLDNFSPEFDYASRTVRIEIVYDHPLIVGVITAALTGHPVSLPLRTVATMRTE